MAYANAAARVASSGAAFVPVVESADLRDGDNPAGVSSLHHSGFWRIFIQRQVSPGLVIISPKRLQMAAQRSFTENDDVIQAFTADCADHAFHESTLPG